jgi:hypothetical protein
MCRQVAERIVRVFQLGNGDLEFQLCRANARQAGQRRQQLQRLVHEDRPEDAECCQRSGRQEDRPQSAFANSARDLGYRPAGKQHQQRTQDPLRQDRPRLLGACFLNRVGGISDDGQTRDDQCNAPQQEQQSQADNRADAQQPHGRQPHAHPVVDRAKQNQRTHHVDITKD